MSTTLVTPTTENPVTLAEFKEYLRIDGDDENAQLQRFLNAAIVSAQQWTRRQFTFATYEYTVDFFPAGRIDLPLTPLSSVVSIKYIDSDGDEQTLDTADYVVTTGHEPGFVEPAYNVSWPTTRNQTDAVTIQFIAGYGIDGATVPDDVRLLIELIASTWYECRGALSESQTYEKEYTIKTLTAQLKVPELF